MNDYLLSIHGNDTMESLTNQKAVRRRISTMSSEQVQNAKEILAELQGTMPQLCESEATAMLHGNIEAVTVARQQRHQRQQEIAAAEQLFIGASVSFMSEGEA